MLDIDATSIDYDPRVEGSQIFFKTIQNKMHWAAHGHTAAEVIVARADAAQPNMGLTSWVGELPQGGRGGREELPQRGRTQSPQPHRDRVPGARRAAGVEPQTYVHGGLDHEARRGESSRTDSTSACDRVICYSGGSAFVDDQCFQHFERS